MYYALNLQGDVVRILNANGSTMVKYAYNAWGEVISVTNANDVPITNASHIGLLNPLRYRGYYYDSETSFYYLQSRYYDPVIHRFINADSYTSTGQGALGHNMFSYCRNNSVRRIDDSGYGDKEDIDGDGDFYEIDQYGGGGNGAYAGHNYGGHVSAPTSSYASSGYNASGYYSHSVSYTTTASTTYSTSSTHTGSYGYGSYGYGSYSYGSYSYGSYGYGSYSYGGENRYTGDQQALIELVDEQGKNMTMESAQTLVEWGKEYGFKNCRIDIGHENGKNAVTQGPHLHLGPRNHVQIFEIN